MYNDYRKTIGEKKYDRCIFNKMQKRKQGLYRSK